MVNLLQTQDAIMTALDPYLSLEDKLKNESQLGDSIDLEDASESSTVTEEQKSNTSSNQNEDSDKESGTEKFYSAMNTGRSSSNSHNRMLDDGNYFYSYVNLINI